MQQKWLWGCSYSSYHVFLRNLTNDYIFYFQEVICSYFNSPLVCPQIFDPEKEANPSKTMLWYSCCRQPFCLPHSKNFSQCWSQSSQSEEWDWRRLPSHVANHIHAWFCKYAFVLEFKVHDLPLVSCKVLLTGVAWILKGETLSTVTHPRYLSCCHVDMTSHVTKKWCVFGFAYFHLLKFQVGKVCKLFNLIKFLAFS